MKGAIHGTRQEANRKADGGIVAAGPSGHGDARGGRRQLVNGAGMLRDNGAA